MNKMQNMISSFSRRNTRRRRLRRVLSFFMAITVFCTTYALILPAITWEEETFCGYTAHEEHGDECYTVTRTLRCERSEGGHIHDESCYELRDILICELEERDGHQHTDDCYVLEGHSHGEACYDAEGVLICELEESDEQPVLVCELEERDGHQHTDTCYTQETTLICEQAEEAPHEHTDECYTIDKELRCQQELHEHTLQCFSNPEADLESAAVWERSVASATLSGAWAEDLLAVARTQLGNGESSRNYQVGASNEKHGYTRYGAWYGLPYDPWCAMFVSFCLNYAEIPADQFPREISCARWTKLLRGQGLWREAGDYAPQAGDLIFFDNDGDLQPDHVGIVAEVNEEGNSLRTIEGNNSTCVDYFSYAQDASHILGYGAMPENPALPSNDAQTGDDAQTGAKEDGGRESSKDTPEDLGKQAPGGTRGPAVSGIAAPEVHISQAILQWNSGSTTTTISGNTLTITPESNPRDPALEEYWSSVVATMTFGLSEGTAPAYSLEIRLPGTVFYDREGNPTGKAILPLSEYPNTGNSPRFPFNYEIDSQTGELILRNYDELEAGSVYVVDVQYKFLPTMVANRYTFDTVNAQFHLNREGGDEEVTTNNLKVVLNTNANFGSLAKHTAPAPYKGTSTTNGSPPAGYSLGGADGSRVAFSWPSSLGPAPADADDYVYITWRVSYFTSLFSGEYLGKTHPATLPYELVVVSDSVNNGTIIAINNQLIDSGSVNGTVVERLNPDGSYEGDPRSIGGFTVTTKHPKSSLSSSRTTIRNDVTLEMRPYDGGSVTRRSSSATINLFIPQPSAGSGIISKSTTEYADGIPDFLDGSRRSFGYVIGLDMSHGKETNGGTRTVLDTLTENGAISVLKGTKNPWTTTSTQALTVNVDYTFDSLELKELNFKELYFDDSGALTYRTIYDDSYYAVEPVEAELWVKDQQHTMFYLWAKAIRDESGSRWLEADGNPIDPNRLVGDDTLKLPDGCTSFETRCANNQDGCVMRFTVNVTFRDTAKIINAMNSLPVGERYQLRFRNTVTGVSKVQVQGGSTIVSTTATGDIGLDRFEVQHQHALTKTVSSRTDYQTDYKTTVSYSIRYRGSDTLGPNYAKHADEVQCVGKQRFYDLLPMGQFFDGSLNVRSATSQMTCDLIGYWTIDDWRGSGRQMLIVEVDTHEVNLSSYCYSDLYISYTATSLWDYMNAGVQQCTNSVAMFPVGRELSGNATVYPDNGYPLGSDKSWFNDVNDDGANAGTVLYAQASVEITALHRDHTGLMKRVKGSYNTEFGEEARTGQGSTYSYELFFTAKESGQTRNVVVFDALENAHNGAEHWNGTFLRVNTGALLAKGIRPTVYYSTHAAMKTADFETDTTLANLSNRTYWTTTLPADPSTVTAIAVDMGSYVFSSLEKAWFTIQMEAPTDTSFIDDPLTPDDESVLAYNRAFVRVAGITVPTKTETVTVKLVNSNTVEIHKSSTPASGTAAKPALVEPGEEIIYHIRVVNLDSQRLTQYTVEDTLPEWVTISDAQKNRITVTREGTEYPLPYSGWVNARPTWSGNKITINGNRLDALGNFSNNLTFNIPCTVKEDTPDRTLLENTAYITRYKGSRLQDPIASETTYHIVLRNGSLSFSKDLVAQQGEDLDQYFKVSVHLTDMSQVLDGTRIDVTDNGSYSSNPSSLVINGNWCDFWIKNGETITIDGIPYGVEYSVREYSQSGCVVHYLDDLGNETTTGTLDRPQAHVGITNYLGEGSLSFTKTVAGSGGDENAYFDVKVTLRVPDLGGSAYTYTCTVDPRGSATNPTNTSTIRLARNAEEVTTFRIKHGETITLNNVPWGTVYSIQEESADNYVTSYVNELGEAANSGVLDSPAEQVDITNTYESRDVTIKVKKVIENEEALSLFPGPLGFTFKYQVDDGAEQSFTLANGEIEELVIPYGASFKLWESETNGWVPRFNYAATDDPGDWYADWEFYMPEDSLDSVTEDLVFLCINEYHVGKVVLMKEIMDEEGNPVEDDTQFSFRVSFTDADGNPWFWPDTISGIYDPREMSMVYRYATPDEMQLNGWMLGRPDESAMRFDFSHQYVELTLGNRDWAVIYSIPGVLTAHVEELDADRYATRVHLIRDDAAMMPSPYGPDGWEGPDKTDANLHATGTAASLDIAQWAGGGEFSMPYTPPILAFVNTPATKSVTVRKEVVGATTAQQNESFFFKLTVKNPDDSAFNAKTLALPTGVTGNADGEITFSLKHGESVEITDLPENAKVVLKETGHPGYNVYMKRGVVDLADGDETAELVLTDDLDITVYNTLGVSLPNTGGVGTQPFTLGGLILGGASLLLLQRRRRRCRA